MLRALLQSMRPKQWPKNGVIFAAVAFDRQLSLSNPGPFLHSLAGFFLFCLLSSSVYIINDLMDIEADRRHPKKRLRPIASGRLPKTVAIGAVVAILLFTLPAAYLLSPSFALICVAYFVQNLLYSFWLKHIPLIDVLVLAAGFVLRVAGGVALVSVERFSPWLYVVTTLGALYLGFGKRRAELNALAAALPGDGNSTRRVLSGYTIPLLDQYITIVSSTTLIAYSLYTFSAPNLPGNHTMMLTIPFALYGIFRYLYLIQVKQTGEAPEDLLLTDRPIQIVIALWVLAILAIFYFPGNF